jgi:hypothetical protein
MRLEFGLERQQADGVPIGFQVPKIYGLITLLPPKETNQGTNAAN